VTSVSEVTEVREHEELIISATFAADGQCLVLGKPPLESGMLRQTRMKCLDLSLRDGIESKRTALHLPVDTESPQARRIPLESGLRSPVGRC
jgi:hypothetical protein